MYTAYRSLNIFKMQSKLSSTATLCGKAFVIILNKNIYLRQQIIQQNFYNKKRYIDWKACLKIRIRYIIRNLKSTRTYRCYPVRICIVHQWERGGRVTLICARPGVGPRAAQDYGQDPELHQTMGMTPTPTPPSCDSMLATKLQESVSGLYIST